MRNQKQADSGKRKRKLRKVFCFDEFREYREDVLEYEIVAQRKFAGCSTWIFFGSFLVLMLFEVTSYHERSSAPWLCLLAGVLSGINYSLFRNYLPKQRKRVMIVGYIYFFLIIKGLTTIHAMSDSYIPWTLLLCAIITTSMISMIPFLYMVILVSALLLNIAEYVFTMDSLEQIYSYILDNVLILVFCLGINIICSRNRYELFEKNRQLQYDSIRDPLTQLFNRRYIENYYVSQVDKNGLAAMLLLDLDNFKNVNDIYGHEKGDEILCRVSNILRGAFREMDCIARLGGDEFVVLLLNVPNEQIVVERVQKVLKQFPLTVEEDEGVEVSVSIGVAFKQPGESISYDKLCKKADVGMYRAKAMDKAKGVIAPDAFMSETIITA
jgi:diguanylate cyclase (GGDEF)-like protein